MNITIADDEGAHHYFHNVKFEVGAAVLHVLANEPKPLHSVITGACMCSSFSQDVRGAEQYANCLSCGHPYHNTRAFCGALR